MAVVVGSSVEDYLLVQHLSVLRHCQTLKAHPNHPRVHCCQGDYLDRQYQACQHRHFVARVQHYLDAQ